MESKKINQLATEMAPVASDLTIIGDPITGVSKKITLEQLAVLFGGAISFYSSYASFPATGDVDIIYCAKDTNKLYLWNGAYVEIFPSQALLDTYQLRSEKGNANGYASLDSLGKVPVSQLPSSLMEYKGTWNASTNTPTLANGTGDTGDVYICSVAGTVNFGAGAITFAVGDYVIYSGSIWQRSSGATGTVTSVAVTESGDALTITGSPITTSGTINIGFAGSSAQYVAGDGSLVTFPTIFSEARSLVTEVYNSTGATLTKGTVVYINGGQGNLPTITKAQANSEVNSAQTYGVVKSDITNMNNGYVIVAGSLGNLDTQAYSAGTTLYLSPSTAGAYTSTKPTSPNHIVYIGVIVRSHPTQGVIEVNIQNTQELGESADVLLSSPANNEGLFYESSTSLWKNKSIATVLGYTPISLASLSASSPLSYNNTTGAFSISQASGSTDGYLSSTDWTTFNSKQDALTNPITGTGASGRIAYFNGTTTQTSSANLTWDATNNRLGIGLNNPQRSLEIYNATADSHLRLSGAAPTVSMGEAITGAVYQAKFGLITENGQFVTGGLAGDFVIISQTGATIWATSGGEKMRLTSGGNLGIGTTSPTFTLQVSGTTRISGQLSLGSTITNATYTYTLPGATGTLALTSNLSSYLPLSGGTLTGALTVTNNVTIRPTSGYNAYFQTSGTAVRINYLNDALSANVGAAFRATDYSFQDGSGSGVLTINSTGLIGIGTTTPGVRLVNAGATLAETPTLGSATIGANAILSANGLYGIYTGVSSAGYVWQQVQRNDGNSSVYALALQPSGGNVGIGTTTPANLLDVVKSGTNAIRVQNTLNTSDAYLIAQNTGGSAFFGINATGPYIYTASALDFTLLTNNAERMRITSGGNVLVSTTTSNNAVFKLQVGDGSSDARALFNSNNPYSISVGNGASSLWYIGVNAQTASNGLQFYSNQLGGVVMTINTSGQVGINTTTFDFGEKLCLYSTTSYTLQSKRSGTGSEGHFAFSNANGAVGSIFTNGSATSYNTSSDYRLKQDLKQFNGLNLVSAIKTYDFEWKSDNTRMYGVLAHELKEVLPYAVVGEKDGEQMQGVDYSKIVPVLIKAIQELKAEIDELKNK